MRLARRLFPVTPEFHGERFFVRVEGKRLATPMFIVLVTVFNFSNANIFTLVSIVSFGFTIYLITLMPEALLGLVARDTTRASIPFDFARDPRIHQCFELRRAAPGDANPSAT